MATETPTFADRLAKLTSQLVELNFELESDGETAINADLNEAWERINDAVGTLTFAGKILDPEFESKIGPTEEEPQ